ncbi:hypothetical protein [Marinospirillum alkaliphilum]|uniref:Uncharacterized protein n=1 Tax=Marinospirillum alkaliphilum DSM 21637 TaxID=1122209 RepID=A0A1K1XZD7_9GAMM|nr:hypothetical protein [Marinospirillum alkaliphilum]SFX54675.1 hypothetical protein SAMN02745752_02027 [Marinospirillum alkaliphilum DSM 21637]
MSDPVAIISAIAAILSAIGGGIACIAAFRSAKHAKDTFDAGELSEKRLLLRQLSITAHEVAVEVDRIKWVAQGLHISYKTLFTFAGQFNSSRQQMYERDIDAKMREADNLLEKAKPFTNFQDSLLNGPLEEIASREVKIAQALLRARIIREKLEGEQRSVEVQNQANQERTPSSRGK